MDFKVIKTFSNKTLVEFSLQTGRTHQIRVHCKWMGHPIVGDDVYGKAEKSLKGQLLHSYFIQFCHPRTKEAMHFEAALPTHFQEYLDKLK